MTSDDRGPLPPTEFTPATARAYRFTTEHLAEVVGPLELAGLDVCAVCGSGDFALNALASGARTVDAVDVMATACWWAELKAACLTVLDRKAFLSFAGPGGDFHFDVYASVRPALTADAAAHFDRLIVPDAAATAGAMRAFLIDKLPGAGLPLHMNPYLQDDAGYRRAASGVDRLTLHAATLERFLAAAPPEAYDLVYASNVFAYLTGREIDAHAALAATRLRPGGRLVTHNVVDSDGAAAVAIEFDRRLAARNGLVASHRYGTAPPMDPAAGWRSLVCSMAR